MKSKQEKRKATPRLGDRELEELASKAVVPPYKGSVHRELDARSTQALAQAAAGYTCLKCKDTGFVGEGVGEYWSVLGMAYAHIPMNKIPWCDCAKAEAYQTDYADVTGEYEQLHIQRLFKNAAIPARFKVLTFDTFPTDKLSGKADALREAKMFAQEGHAGGGIEGQGLGLIGPPGVGKTGILSPAFQTRIALGTAGLWIQLYDFFGRVQSTYTPKEDSKVDSHELIQAAKEVPLLFLDDIGKMTLTNTTNGQMRQEKDDKVRILWDIVNYRHGEMKATLWTSNLKNRQAFAEQWGEPISQRLWEMSRVIPVTGEVLRERP